MLLSANNAGDLVVSLRGNTADGTAWDRTEIVRRTGLGLPGKPVLYGSSGDDVFDSRGQAYDVWGYGGSDTYLMDRGDGAVTIRNDYHTSSPHGHLAFAQAVAPDQIWFAQSGNDLVATILGTADAATVKDWFASPGTPIVDVQAAGAGHGWTAAWASSSPEWPAIRQPTPASTSRPRRQCPTILHRVLLSRLPGTADAHRLGRNKQRFAPHGLSAPSCLRESQRPCTGLADLASVSMIMRPFSSSVRRTTVSVSTNVRRKQPLLRVEPFIIARRYS